LEKVLNRLPEEIKEKVLSDNSLQIIVAGDFNRATGLYLQFEDGCNSVIYLNSSVLNQLESESNIIHAFAHEIAHYIAGRGRTGLPEKEAEDLLVKWSFSKEVGEAYYSRPLAETTGYDAGYKWAQEQDEQELMERFGEYLAEYEEDRLSSEREEELFYVIDPMSILSEMGTVGELSETIEEESSEKGHLDIESLEKGVVWGIMKYLSRTKIERASRFSQKERCRVEVADSLERIANEFERLFSLSGFSEYLDESAQLGIIDLSKGIHDLLDKAK
jgi:hypothetical protein